VWIVAHANRQGEHDGAKHAEMGGASQLVADANQQLRDQGRPSDAAEDSRGRHADRGCVSTHIRDANVSGLAFPERQSRDVGEEFSPAIGADWWLVEPDVGRVANGVPARVDRLRALGNAVVPQITEMIGRAIMASR
jgi:DNA (cytosine-5)-methyltransferase 1